eukprot:1245195-Amphidinium_carterae.1
MEAHAWSHVSAAFGLPLRLITVTIHALLTEITVPLLTRVGRSTTTFSARCKLRRASIPTAIWVRYHAIMLCHDSTPKQACALPSGKAFAGAEVH